MELNRNHYFVIGIVLILVGIQIRMVDTYVLNESASKRFAEKQDKTLAAGYPFMQMAPTDTRKSITPEPWVGWLVLSAGAVLTLHSMAMPKPGG